MTPISRHLKVFISSTFQDMQEEREILLKDTFLKLKKIAKSRAVEITEIDLRTGITQEQEESGDIVKICLDEIERCANSPIFFLGMLGNRYGWDEWHKHTNKETLEDHKYSWVNEHIGCSVTELEILSAIENSSDNRAFLFLKESKDSDDKRLIELKHSLTQKASNSNLLVTNYKDKNEFRDKTIETFTKALDELYPEDKKPTEVERLRGTHQSFAKSRQKVYISHPKNKSILDEFIAGEQDRLLLYGESGYGKSALIANYFEEFTQDSDSFVIEHYIGGAGELSNDLHQMLSRVMLEIKEEFGIEDKIPTEPQKIMDEFALWLHRVKRPTIIVLDGYNQIEDALKEKLFYYIPDKLEQVKIIITSIKKDYPIENSYQIEALSQEEQRELIISYLKAYGKTISKPIQNEILKHPQTNNTLFLRTLLNEIRLLGSFDNLDKDIANYLQAKDVVQLFIKIFERLESDYRENLAKEVLSLLYVSRDGLSEDNLMEIINQNSTHKLTRLEFSPLFLAVEEHLINIFERIYTFFHIYIREAIQKKYLNSENILNQYHEKLVNYFEEKEDSFQKTRELPYQLIYMQNRDRLYKNLIRIDFFMDLLYAPYELVVYVRYINENHPFENNLTIKLLDKSYSNAHDIDAIANFLHLFLSKYQYALSLFLKSLDICENNLDKNHLSMSVVYNNIALIYKYLGDSDKSLFFFEKSIQVDGSYPITYNNIAELYRHKGEYKKALYYYHISCSKINKNDLEESYLATATIYNNLSSLHSEQGNLKKSLKFVKKSIAIRKKILGDSHPITLMTYSNLALCLYKFGEYTKSLNIYKKKFKKLLIVFGEKHSNVATIYNNLALLLQDIGHYIESLKLHQKSLKIKEDIFGKNHYDTAMSYNNISQFYLTTGNYQKALLYCNKSLEIHINLFGENHLSTATSYHNLSEINKDLGNYDKSLEFLNKSLSIKLRLFKEEHPETINDYNSLGQLYLLLGNNNKAQIYLEKSLNINKKLFGETHPNTAMIYNDLGTLFQSIGELDKGLSLVERSLEINEVILNKKHPTIATNYHNMAYIFQSMGKYDISIYFFNKSLEMNIEIFGEEHLSTIMNYNYLAISLQYIGKYEEAWKILQNILKVNENKFGTDHINTALNYKSIAQHLAIIGNHTEAIKFLNKSLTIYKNYLGDNHNTVAMTYTSLALSFQHIGDYQKALNLFQRSLEIISKIFDENNPYIVEIYYGLASTYYLMENFEYSIELYKKSISICEKTLGENHLTSSTNYNGLGLSLQRVNKNKESLYFFEKALKIRKDLFQNNHILVAESYNSIGMYFYYLKEYDKSIVYYESSISIYRELLGETHFSLATTYNNVAMLYYDTHEYQEAYNYLIKAIDILNIVHPENIMKENLINATQGIKEKLNIINNYSWTNSNQKEVYKELIVHNSFFEYIEWIESYNIDLKLDYIKIKDNFSKEIILDKYYFYKLLFLSFSFTMDEKYRMFQSISVFSQLQINDIVNILEKEIQQFKIIDKEYYDELENLWHEIQVDCRDLIYKIV